MNSRRSKNKTTPTSDSTEKRGEQHLVNKLFAPVENAWLAVLRVSYGSVLLWLAWHYFQAEPRNFNKDRIATFFIDPPFHYTFVGFGWVKPWPGDWCYVHIAVMGIAAALVVLGLFYRASSIVLFLTWTQVFLMERGLYQNHNYLLVLICFLMMFMPANRVFALDCALRPSLRTHFVPAWTLWLMRLQLAIPYFYGGLVKIDNDWLHAFPMRLSLPAKTDNWIIGAFADKLWFAYFISYTGLLFDLFIVPLLLWRRTRIPAFLMAMTFHLANSQIFLIDVFPWFMIGATLIFFPPDFARSVCYRIMRVPLPQHTPEFKAPAVLRGKQKVILACCGIYAAVQLLVPFRHYLYPNDVDWTGEGYYFSWRMMLNRPEAIHRFFAYDPDLGGAEPVNPFEHMSNWQLLPMRHDADMIVNFAHHVAENYRKRGHRNIEIHVYAICSLNGRKPQLLIDSHADLAQVERSLWSCPALLPNKEPLHYPGWSPDPTGWESLPEIAPRLWRPDQK